MLALFYFLQASSGRQGYMKKLIIMLIAIIFLTDNAYGKGPFLTGADWKKFTEQEKSPSFTAYPTNKVIAKTYKLLFVRGIYEGIFFVGDEDAKNMLWPKGEGLDFEPIIDGLDHFYSDYRNIKIPVVTAIPVILLEMHGQDPQKIEGVKRELRKEHL